MTIWPSWLPAWRHTRNGEHLGPATALQGVRTNLNHQSLVLERIYGLDNGPLTDVQVVRRLLPALEVGTSALAESVDPREEQERDAREAKLLPHELMNSEIAPPISSCALCHA